MKQPETFTSPIGPLITRYLALKRALGRRAVSMAYILRHLDRFLVSCQAADLTRESFSAWGESMASLHPTTRRARLRTVYHFCNFRRREDPHAFVPDATQFPPQGPRPLPYIFSEADVAHLLAAAGSLAPHQASPLQREVAQISIVILYTTGLRRGELVRLTLSDYEVTNHVLHVRQTKFDKSRLVPLSADGATELDRYLTARQKLGAPCDGDAPLLVHNHGGRFRGYTGAGFGQLLRKVIRATGIRTPQGRAPRVHDLRFTFAAQALLRWYRADVDVQTRLPALATYLGHVSVMSTQYYLTFLRATAEAASERFHIHSAGWLTPIVREGGRP
jgi:site-specific recombinase XerD